MKVLKVVAIVIGAAALIATGIGVAAGFSVGASFGAVTGGIAAATGLSTGLATALVVGALAIDAMSLASALSPKPKNTSGGETDKWKADPYAGIPYSMGRSYTGGNIIFRRGHGQNNVWQTFVTALSLGTIASIEASFADFNQVNYNGFAATGTYANHIYQSTQLGATPESGQLPPPADTPTGWDSTCKLSGIAAVMNSFKYDTTSSNSFTSIPQLGWVVHGVSVYDPRLDSTYPGGSGSCRAGVESTYVYSENPGLHALTWAIGRFQNGTRVAGIGAPISTLDVASFVECANLCDARSWKVGGQVYTRPDTLWNSLQAILQAGGATPVFYAGQISVINQAPKVSLATITTNDIVGDASFAATTARRDRINQVIPQYRSEANQWQLVSAKAVSVALYATEDGDERTKEISYPLVQDVNQVSELALYDICDSREAGPGKIPVKPWFLNFRPGDCVTFQPEDGASVKVSITGRELDADTGMVTLDVRGETDSKHAFALGETGTPPPITTLTYSNAVAAPLAGDWTPTGSTVAANGTTYPAIEVDGACSNTSSDAVIFEFREHNPSLSIDAGWTGTGIEAPTITSKILTPVKSSTSYDVAVRYRVRGILGDRQLYGPVTSGQGATDWATVGGTGKPQDYATVGAQLGTNTRDSKGNIVGDADAITNQGTAKDTSNVNGVPSTTITSQINSTSATVYDTTPPDAPTGLALSSSVSADALGNQIVTLTAKWNPSQAADTASYSLEIAENGGGFVARPNVNQPTYSEVLPAAMAIQARVRAFDRNTNASGYSATVSLTLAKDTTPPAAASNISASNLGTGGVQLAWTNPGDSDLASANIWQSATNDTTKASQILTVTAQPNQPGGALIGGTSGSTNYFWIQTVDTSGNKSALAGGVSGTVASVSNANMLPGLEVPANVATLPAANGYTGPALVYNQADKKLYRYANGAFTTSVAGTDILPASIPNSAFTSGNLSSLPANAVIQNALISLDGNGALQGIGSGAGTTVANSSISLSGGALSGIGTGNGTTVANSLLSINANGQLNGGGGGQVTIGGLGYTGALNATLGDNLVLNPLMNAPATDWMQNANLVIVAGGSGDPVTRYQKSTASQTVGMTTTVKIPANSPSLYISFWLYRTAGQQITLDLSWSDIAGNNLQQTRFTSYIGGTVGAWQLLRYTLMPPQRAVQFQYGHVVTTSDETRFGGYVISTNGLNADNTQLDPKVASMDIGAAAGDNLLTNGDFTSGFANWNPNAGAGTGVVMQASAASDPANFVRVAGGNSNFGINRGYPTTFPIEPNKTVYFSGRIRSSVSGLQTVFYLTCYDAKINSVGGGSVNAYIQAANTWQTVEFPIVIPSTAVYASPGITLVDPGSGQTVDLANVRLGNTQRSATVGAPPGTMVGSTDAAKIETRANDPGAWINTGNTTTISGGRITTGSIMAAQIAAATITSQQIASGTITASQIASATITANNIAASTITGNLIAGNTIQGQSLVAGTITGDRIAASTITGNLVAANTIVGNNIAAGTITGNNIVGGTITGNLIAASAITTSKLAVLSDNLFGDPQFRDPNFFTQANPTGLGSGYSTGGTWYYSTSSDNPTYAGGIGSYRIDSSYTGNGSVVLVSPIQGGVSVNTTYGASCVFYNNTQQAMSFCIQYVDKNGSVIDGGVLFTVAANDKGLQLRTAQTSTSNTAVVGYHLYVQFSGAIGSNQIAVTGNWNLRKANGGEMFVDGTINASKIIANSLTSSQIAANTITGNNIASNTITANNVVAGTLTAAQLAAGTITASKLGLISDNLFLDPNITDGNYWSTGLYAYQDSPAAWYINDDSNFTATLGTSKHWCLYGGVAAVTNAPSSTAQALVPPAVPVSTTSIYSISFGMNAYSNRNTIVDLWWRDANGNVVFAQNLTAVLAGNSVNQIFTFQITPPSGYPTIKYAQLAIYLAGNGSQVSSNTTVRFTNLQIRKANDASMFVDGTITASKIVAGSITSNQIAGGSITGDRISTTTSLPGSVTIGNTGVSIGVVQQGVASGSNGANLLAYSDFPAQTTGFQIGFNPNNQNVLFQSASYNGKTYMVWQWTPPNSNSTTVSILSNRVAVTAGAYLYIGAYQQISNCNMYANARFRDISGSALGGPNLPGTTGAGFPTSTSQNWEQCRFGSFVTVPSTAATVEIEWYANSTGSSQATTWVAAPMIITCSAGQTVPPSYTSGPVPNAAAVVNANTTQINPGQILISGGTSLANWRNGSDNTKIEGGSIAANTITANKLTIGNRNLNFPSLTFQVVNGYSAVSWPNCYAQWADANGNPQQVSIGAATQTLGSGFWYFYWTEGSSSIASTTNSGMLLSPGYVILATWQQGTPLLVQNYGGTIIDGSQITTGTITANQIAANSITGDRIQGGTVLAASIQVAGQSNNLGNISNAATAGQNAANAGMVSAPNRIPYSGFEAGSNGGSWQCPAYNPGGYANDAGAFVFNGKVICKINCNFTNSYGSDGNQQGSIEQTGRGMQFWASVQPGETVFASALIETSNLTVQGILIFSASDGSNQQGVTFCNGFSNGAFPNSANANWSGWRQGGFATVPQGCTKAALRFYGHANGSGGGFMSISEPMICGATSGQTQWPNYSPGPSGIDPAQIINNAQNYATTTINGGRITTGTITAGQIAATTITTDRLVDRSVTQSFVLNSGQTWTGNGGTNGGSGSGGSSGGSGGGTGGGGACPEVTLPILLARPDRCGPGEWTTAGDLAPGQWVWTQHEHSMEWGAFEVVRAKKFEAELWEVEGLYRATSSHPIYRDGSWVTYEELGAPSGWGVAVAITVASAHTFIGKTLSGDTILNHNKTVNPDQ